MKQEIKSVSILGMDLEVDGKGVIALAGKELDTVLEKYGINKEGIKAHVKAVRTMGADVFQDMLKAQAADKSLPDTLILKPKLGQGSQHFQTTRMAVHGATTVPGATYIKSASIKLTAEQKAELQPFRDKFNSGKKKAK